MTRHVRPPFRWANPRSGWGLAIGSRTVSVDPSLQREVVGTQAADGIEHADLSTRGVRRSVNVGESFAEEFAVIGEPSSEPRQWHAREIGRCGLRRRRVGPPDEGSPSDPALRLGSLGISPCGVAHRRSSLPQRVAPALPLGSGVTSLFERQSRVLRYTSPPPGDTSVSRTTGDKSCGRRYCSSMVCYYAASNLDRCPTWWMLLRSSRRRGPSLIRVGQVPSCASQGFASTKGSGAMDEKDEKDEDEGQG